MDEKDNKEEPQVQGPEAAEDAEDDAPLQGSALSVAHELLPISLESEMKRSYLDYAMSVIVGRALPDVRDGLKPVHRRVLHAMNEIKNTHNNPTKKAARVVGEVLGKYHPHGDSAAYMTIVRMAQPFSLRYPLIFGQGNFGSIDGDSPAAMRYTEVRLEKIAGEMLADINEDTVDFVPNFDNSERSPSSCRPVCLSFSSTAPPASPWAWPRTSRRTISARRSTPACTSSAIPSARSRTSFA